MTDYVDLFTGNTSIMLLFALSFLGGLIASVSPCSLAMLPIIIGYVGGYSDNRPFKTFVQLVFFIMGTAVVFSVIGIICAITGKVFVSAGGSYFSLIIASIVMVMGLKLVGVLDFEIPVLTLTNVKGYKATKCSEANMARNAAELTNAFISATIPKVNVIIGEAFGSAYLTMNSKSTGADMVYAWPSAQIGMMDAKLAAKIMYAGSDVQTINEKAAEYAMLQSSALSAAKRGYVDTIIQPADTRKYVIGAFEMLFTKREERPAKMHGTV